MNTPTKSVLLSPTKISPTGVIQEANDQFKGVPEFPDISINTQHQVSFSDEVGSIHSNLTEELVQELWFSRQEIQDFHGEAKQQANDFREEHSELVQELCTLVQTCSTKGSSLPALFRSPSAQQIIKALPGTTVRGLEGRLHVIFGRSRVLHRQGLLALQKHCPQSHDADYLEQLLRSRSLDTSRASRALARLLAHGDYLHIVDVLRQELQESNEDTLGVD
jgi:hypothetical protein